MKTCKKCNIEKSFNEFYHHKGHKNNIGSHCKECVKAYQQKPEIRDGRKLYRAKPNVKFKLNKDRLARCHNNLMSWIPYLPVETNCEICGVVILFSRKNPITAICFDHKSDNCIIKGSPYDWLIRNLFNKENKLKWDSCNFGKLCRRCNFRLPTVNREEWIKSVTKYMKEDK